MSDVSRRNPSVVITLADVGGDEENDSLTHVSTFLYSKGRWRVVKSFSFDGDNKEQRVTSFAGVSLASVVPVQDTAP